MMEYSGDSDHVYTRAPCRLDVLLFFLFLLRPVCIGNISGNTHSGGIGSQRQPGPRAIAPQVRWVVATYMPTTAVARAVPGRRKQACDCHGRCEGTRDEEPHPFRGSEVWACVVLIG